MNKQLLLIVMLLSTVASAFAVEVEIDGLWYEVVAKAKEAKVIQYKNYVFYNGDIVIPKTVVYEGVTCSVMSIGKDAFNGCSGLTSVTIPNSVTSIGDTAFEMCSGLTSITIPNSVTSIGVWAFIGCSGLKKVIVKDIAAWCGISFSGTSSNPLSNAQHLYSDENTEITELIIPKSVTSIGNCAFCLCSGLTSVAIPNSVTNIGEYAFIECSGLTSVTIPNSVTSIGGEAFWGCSGLTSATIGNSVTSIGGGAFGYCSGLTSVTIPNSVTSIGGGAFGYCSGLTSVTIPNSVTSIGDYAFQNCSGLTSVVIGGGVKTIGSRAFANCLDLTDVTCYAENVPSTQSNAFEGSYIKYVTLHVPTTSIDAYKTTEPWSGFKTIIGLDGTLPEIKKCTTPAISYTNGQLIYTCDTEGAECVTNISDADIKTHFGNEVSLTATYNISVYAAKAGYENSDVATATLCWIDQQPATEGVADGIAYFPAKAVLIQSNGGQLTIEGAKDGERITVYSINGTQAGSAISNEGSAVINTNLQPGNVAIVRIGQKSVKVMVK